MREIKFRVWDIDGNQFWDDSLGDWKIEFLSGNEPRLIVLEEVFSPLGDQDFYWRDVENVVFQEYTGLKDKNGKDIYDGDIIEWDEKEWGMPYREVAEWNYELLHSRENDWKQFCIVIGNFYENPELITP